VETAPATGFLWTCRASGRGSPSSPPAVEEAAGAEEAVGARLSVVGLVAG
jgi:hypothetical protein